jgi:hypothetical protein
MKKRGNQKGRKQERRVEFNIFKSRSEILHVELHAFMKLVLWLMGKHRLMVCESRILRKIFESGKRM